MLVTELAQAIRFSEEDCRPMGRVSQGVKGINLAAGDGVLSMAVVSPDEDLFVITENGYGKRTAVTKYPRQRRGGMGVKTIKPVEGKGQLKGARVVKENQELLIVSTEGIMIRMPVEGISRLGRLTQGVKVMNLGEGDAVAAVARVVAEDDEDVALEE
jgi:DNA gyrase subunit A